MAFQERYGEIRRRIVQIILAVLIAPLYVVSISPASAEIIGPSLTIDAATETVEKYETASAVVTNQFFGTSANDTLSVTAVLVSMPAGATPKTPKVSLLYSQDGVTSQSDNTYTIDIAPKHPGKVSTYSQIRIDATSLDLAGTYVFRIYLAKKNGEALTYLTWTVTVREPNFKAKITNSASSTGNKVQLVLTNPKDFPNNSWAVKEFTTDANDEVQTYLENGTYEVRLYPNADEATTRVPSVAYTFVINSGVVAAYPTSAAPVSGLYQLTLGTTGLNVTSTIGGTKRAFNVIRITAANGVTKTINPAYLSDKSVSLAIDAGTYKIQVEGTDTKVNGLSGDCVVTTSSVSTCDVVIAANNFPFQVVGSSGETLTALVSTTLLGVSIYRTIDGKYLDYESVFQGTDSETVSLQNGAYRVNIHKNMKAYWTYRSDASYSMTIAGGVVTALTSITTGESVSLSGPRYLLPIPGDNFKMRAMGGSSPSASGSVCFYNRTGGSNACMSRDSSGELSTRLFNGTTDIDVYSNSTDFVTARYTATVASGVVTSIANTLGETFTAQSDFYVLPLKVANVQGTLTIGGVAKYGYFRQVIDKTSGNSVNIFSNGPGWDGKYGLALPEGSYFLSFVPYYSNYWGPSITTDCTVAATGTTTCNATAPANNFSFTVNDINGVKITDYENVEFRRLGTYPQNNYFNNWNNGDFVVALQDGDYEVIVSSSRASIDGQRRTYSFSVTSGVASRVIDKVTGNVIAPVSGVVPLALGRPNFSAVAHANSNPDPNVYTYARQVDGNGRTISEVSTSSSSEGLISMDLPNGLNLVTINPTGNESPTVVSATYSVLIESSTVVSVSKASGETLTVNASGKYVLAFDVPNIVGTMTVDGVATTGYINSIWNTVLNKQVDFGSSGINSLGKYALMIPAGNYDVMFVPNGGVGGVKNCTATAGVSTTCDIAFPASNLSFAILDKTGTKLTSGVGATINRSFNKGQSFPGRNFGFGIGANELGQFTPSIVDGDYTLSIRSYSPDRDGVSREFSFSVESGTVSSFTDNDTLQVIDTATALSGIRLATPNLNLLIKANGAINSNSYVYGYPTAGKSNWYNFSANELGIASTLLRDGEYRFYVNPSGNLTPPAITATILVKVESGTVTSVTDEDAGVLSASGGVYTVNLGTPNLTGTLSVGGVAATDRYISIQGFFNSSTQQWTNYRSASTSRGSYAVKVDAGSYVMTTSENGKAGVMSTCTVGSGNSTCNIDHPVDNFIFKIQSTSGADLYEDVRADVELQTKNWGQGYGISQQAGGLYKSPLRVVDGLDAYYVVAVYPSDGSNRHGVYRRYKVEMSGATITSVKDFVTGAVVTPDANGVYALRLQAPNIAGTVVAPNGTTPIPNTGVRTSGPEWQYFNTDDSGAFAGILNKDGTYDVWAQAPQNDMTKADSAKTSVTVTNGIGASGVRLQLRAPTVVGTVRGPTGVSPGNYVQVLQDFGYGKFAGSDQLATPRYTNSEGKFAFYLDPGTYQFQAQADEENAGGGRTVGGLTPAGGPCVVTDTATVIVCNITLASYNTKIKLLGEGGTAYRFANISFNYQFDKFTGIKSLKYWDWANVNQLGQAKVSLSAGTWNANVDIWGTGNEATTQLKIVIDETGTVTSMTNAKGQVLNVDSDGYYVVQLPVSNLTGTVFEDGDRIDYGAYVNILQENEYGYNYIAGRWINGGKFAFNVAPGTYTVDVYPYAKTGYTSGGFVQTKRYDCTLSETATSVVCDVNLRKGNLVGRITTPTGAPISDSYASVYQVSDDAVSGKNYKWGQGLNIYDGSFTTFLEDGNFELMVYPGGLSQASYTQSRFSITVSSGAITSVRNLNRNETVTAVSGQYSFALTSPAISGSVLQSGTSAAAVQWAQIIPIAVGGERNGEELWEYSTNSNERGKFAMSVPDGTYDIVARSWGKSGGGSTNSGKYRVVVSGGIAGETLTIRMKEPNFKLRVVSPLNSSVGLSDVWVNGNYGNQYFGGSTDNDGYLSAYIDTTTAVTCGTTCRLNIYPGYGSTFTPVSTYFTAVGDIGNVALGVVTSKVTVRIPTNGGVGLPDKWSWLSVQELDGSGNVVSESGYGTNELGQAGLGLVSGTRYRLTAYPSGQYYGRYSPKVYDIASFSPTIHAEISITFDSPNVTFVVYDREGSGNAWGWFEIQQGSGGSYSYAADGYLNDQGRGAVFLADNTGGQQYKMILYPGKSKGVEKTIYFTVSGGNVTASTGATFTSNVGRITMSAGNVTGTVVSDGELLANIPITATSSDGVTKVSTVTGADGSYEFYLDTTVSWTLKAINPFITTPATGTISISAGATSLTGLTITLTVPAG